MVIVIQLEALISAFINDDENFSEDTTYSSTRDEFLMILWYRLCDLSRIYFISQEWMSGIFDIIILAGEWGKSDKLWAHSQGDEKSPQ